MRFEKIPIFGFDRPFNDDLHRMTDAFPNHRLERLIGLFTQAKASIPPSASIGELTAREIGLMIIELHLRRGCDQADQHIIDSLDNAAKSCNMSISELLNELPGLIAQRTTMHALTEGIADQVIKKMKK